MPLLLTLAAFVSPILADFPQQVDTLQTVAERSGYKATARHGDVVALCQELAKRRPGSAFYTELGHSEEGRPLPLLILADPPVRSAAEAARSGKLVVLAIGNIHAGEVCGKEALPMLAREILETPHHPLLKNLIVAFAPIYNADGNERVSKLNRPGQVGPEEGMGQRHNARGLDLNRDFIKLEAAETRALVKFFRAWKPALFIDTHTTNGSHHRYTITYEGPKNPAGDRKIIDYTRTTFFPQLTHAFEQKTGLQTYYYGNFNRDHTKWTTFPAEGRYSTTYAGLTNRLSVLSEAYAYAPFKDRVLATREFVRECLNYASAHTDEISKLLQDAERAVIKAGAAPGREDKVAIRSEPRPLAGTEPILGYIENQENGRAKPTGTPKDYPAQLLHDFVATESVARPNAYLLPRGCAEVLANLQRHGIDVQELREDLDLDVEAYRVDEVGKMVSRGWDRQDMLELRVSPRAESRRIAAGTYLIKTAQPLGNLAVYLLEPRSEDGLAAWKFFDGLKAGTDFPVLRLPHPAVASTTGAEPLAEERRHDLPITFDMERGGRGGRMGFGAGGPLSWLDGNSWLQVREGRPFRVDAATGRSTPFLDSARLVQGLLRLSTIDEPTAQSLARGPFFEMDPAKKGFLFEHNDDLYYASFDGATAVRLTNHPGSEEHAAFSPDGRSVAFVRDYDLYVVDIAQPAERALTTGGSETRRHGLADWVYYEEIYNRRWTGFWWSPDSKRIALMEYDDTPVGTLTLLNDTQSPRKVEQNKYPRAGEPNPKVRLGIVDAGGGAVRWADLAGYSSEAFLISQVGWWSDSQAVYACIQDRVQTWLDLVKLAADDPSPKPVRLFRDSTKAWIADPDPLIFLKDGTFLWMSERDGWKHIYHYSAEGALRGRLTEGAWEVRSIARVDDQSGWIYFTASRDTPTGALLYRTKVGGPIQRLTPGEGSYQVNMSPDGRYYLATWSDLHTPAKVKLFAGDGSLVRVVDTNPSYWVKEYRFAPLERVHVPTRDGFTLEGELILPPDLDPAQKYPVWFMTYGGPHMPMTSEGWQGGRLRDQALAREGFIVYHLDPRSASGKGAASAWKAYKHLGVQELEDIKDGIAWLKQRPYVDGDRIGMSGHSYGGYMTSYALTHSTLFAAGIAGAPVTDWRDYDSIYTERFMGLPQDNPDGYDKSSVVRAARNLHGKLLIIHGAIDDNVSVRNTMRLVEALQAANKDFELMIYPGSRHGVFSPHYSRLQIDFFRRTLGKKPASPPFDHSPVAGGSARFGHAAQ
jgi:dipeptidyl aminopeptidase/acylaminoacyl peptidase